MLNQPSGRSAEQNSGGTLYLRGEGGPRVRAKDEVLAKLGDSFAKEFRSCKSAEEMRVVVEKHKNQMTEADYTAVTNYVDLIAFL